MLLLPIVKKMVSWGRGKLAEEFFIFQHAVQERARRRHAADAGFVLVNGFREQMQRLGVPLEAAPLHHQFLQRALARVAEWRMPEIVREADGFHEVAIDEKILAQRRAARAQKR